MNPPKPKGALKFSTTACIVLGIWVLLVVIFNSWRWTTNIMRENIPLEEAIPWGRWFSNYQ